MIDSYTFYVYSYSLFLEFTDDILLMEGIKNIIFINTKSDIMRWGIWPENSLPTYSSWKSLEKLCNFSDVSFCISLRGKS